jgi:hypothetical protein
MIAELTCGMIHFGSRNNAFGSARTQSVRDANAGEFDSALLNACIAIDATSTGDVARDSDEVIE